MDVAASTILHRDIPFHPDVRSIRNAQATHYQNLRAARSCPRAISAPGDNCAWFTVGFCIACPLAGGLCVTQSRRAGHAGERRTLRLGVVFTDRSGVACRRCTFGSHCLACCLGVGTFDRLLGQELIANRCEYGYWPSSQAEMPVCIGMACGSQNSQGSLGQLDPVESQ